MQPKERLTAQILSYSRSKVVFAGLELNGTAISPDKSDMEGTYGKGVTVADVIKTGKAKAPAEVQIYPQTLTGYSARKVSAGRPRTERWQQPCEWQMSDRSPGLGG
jgi:hypothetical protein